MNDIGLIGLGVMGKSLVLNIEDKGYKIAAYNYTPEETRDLMDNEGKGKNISAFYDLKSFVNSLSKPRKVFLMITAGKPIDSMIEKLAPLLNKDDIIMDGGNSYFRDTNRRINELKEKGIRYLGIGVSGGETGALNGPSLMPGGSIEAYELVKDILIKIAAQTEDGPCCTYIGNGSAGHFVKMIHNGIEYAIMQAISETYDIMRKALKLSSEEIGNIFEDWNSKELNSFLMDISYKIMKHKDEKTKKPLVELVLDKAGQKGTGKWTAQTSLDLGIPTPSLTAAVQGRTLSYFKEYRKDLSKNVYKKYSDISYNRNKIVEELKNSLLFSSFIIFSQGLWLMAEASKVYDYHINLSEVLKIWKGGCIIRSKMLDSFREIIDEDSKNITLLNNKKSLDFLTEKLDSIKDVTSIAADFYIPAIVLNSTIDYFYGMTEENLPANLIQAQRDCFGAHTYERIDEEGIFHTENWDQY
ncbi:MAG TPA: phosphogluconate dehydrogenase (NADP(+)-dependent, decarboxylating) [Clostridiaceae bacterium]|jgi:6-phosphogluconate dehydrogenase|uniref:NADP-dependent phosphogluconate dehydrogenase n=1 Tax=Clostridium tyrobutyricum TaxID=1519 RepID=UPI000E7F47F1|nr:NADP-dependent phosphogluconate dehydrogenase [Clostridium tyrobutyricum]HBN28459.1 phosphogluconate dehydrogenase (NADP(+)-dependent, decarboxylating) [Clostridiaceae bacterium]HBX48327.1 phosphogluconate dehydrogenase (NADP(+)-dependent, decarboxylating) [Clostridiaceae bacterium]